MKSLLTAAIGLLFSAPGYAQDVNCATYPAGTPCRQACDLYQSPPGEAAGQGTAGSQRYFDQILALCPTFAPAWREKAVPYLKWGDFGTWKQLIDHAVQLQPAQNLGYRGWCRFEFLHDYAGAAADLTRLMTLTHGNPGFSNDGDYDLRIVLALCKREQGDPKGALALFDACIAANKAQQRMGLYDYLHRGVTRLRQGDDAGALLDLQLERQQIKQLATPNTTSAWSIGNRKTGPWPASISRWQKPCFGRATTDRTTTANPWIRSISRIFNRRWLAATKPQLSRN